MTDDDIRPPRKSPLKALVWVQHLLGIGHVRRAALITRALSAAGLDVTVASGGFPVAGVDHGAARVVRLPPARSADKSFKRLVGEGGLPLDDAWRERRRAALLDLADSVDPDILLLETYPFGRRQFRFELLPLLERPRRPRVVAASVRDILVAKDDPAREVEMADVARRHLDLVLVHGDPAVVPFEATFPQAHRIADLIRYTGYVAPARAPVHPAAKPGGEGAGAVVVEHHFRIVVDAPLTQPPGQFVGIRQRVAAGHALDHRGRQVAFQVGEAGAGDMLFAMAARTVGRVFEGEAAIEDDQVRRLQAGV